MSQTPTPRRGTTFVSRHPDEAQPPQVSTAEAKGSTAAGAAPGATADAAVDARARVVVDRMIARDVFSQWLGVEVVEMGARRAVIRMTVRAEMMNGFGVGHGGIVFAFADSAHAFATNSDGEISVAVDCSISYPAPIHDGDVLTAVAIEQSTTNRLGFCDVTVRNQDEVVVGHFRGTVYRTHKPLPE